MFEKLLDMCRMNVYENVYIKCEVRFHSDGLQVSDWLGYSPLSQ